MFVLVVFCVCVAFVVWRIISVATALFVGYFVVLVTLGSSICGSYKLVPLAWRHYQLKKKNL